MKAKTPKEDPATKSAREAEQRRADAAFVDNAQGILDDETRRRIRRFGARGGAVRAIGGVGGVGGASGGSGGSGFGGGGSAEMGSGASGGGGKIGGNYQQQVV